LTHEEILYLLLKWLKKNYFLRDQQVIKQLKAYLQFVQSNQTGLQQVNEKILEELKNKVRQQLKFKDAL
jgi:hypothetical protein